MSDEKAYKREPVGPCDHCGEWPTHDRDWPAFDCLNDSPCNADEEKPKRRRHCLNQSAGCMLDAGEIAGGYCKCPCRACELPADAEAGKETTT